jgi:hypothetical protein
MNLLLRSLLILSYASLASSEVTCYEGWTKVETPVYGYCKPADWHDEENGERGRFLCNSDKGRQGKDCVWSVGGLPESGKATIVIFSAIRQDNTSGGPSTLDEFVQERTRPYQDRRTREEVILNARGDRVRIVQVDFRLEATDEIQFLVRRYFFAMSHRFILLSLTASAGDHQIEKYREILYQILRTLEVSQ